MSNEEKNNINVFGENKKISFTISVDAVLKHYGVTIGAIFNIISNRSKMSYGCCTLSERQIAKMIHCSWNTVSRSIEIMLVENLIVLVPHKKDWTEGNTKWYKPVSKTIYELENKTPSPITSNKQRQKSQKSGLEKMSEYSNIWGEKPPIFDGDDENNDIW